jgi:hypothetical protein
MVILIRDGASRVERGKLASRAGGVALNANAAPASFHLASGLLR